MIYMNQCMKQLFVERNDYVTELANKIIQGTRKINDCIIYDCNNEINEDNLNFERIIKRFGDKIGYEVACNDISIEKKDLDLSEIISFFSKLDKGFTDAFHQRMVLYLIEKEDFYELRFHSNRGDGSKWLKEDLDAYNEPIICYVS